MIYHKPIFKKIYENYIGSKWIKPIDRKYFNNLSPIDGEFIAKIPRSNYKDVDLAVKTAWSAYESWGKTTEIIRSNILLKVADKIEENLEKIALIETWDNGKPIRETLNADIPLTIDHFRYFGNIIRAEHGSFTYID